MAFDLILRAARIDGRNDGLADVGIRDGRIAAIEPALPSGGPEEILDGQLVLPGLVETHIHLDKSCIMDRCRIVEGTLQEAISETARAKAAFTEDDIDARARRTLEKVILAGTQFMRTHVEVDPRIGLKSFNVLPASSRTMPGRSICKSASSRRKVSPTIPAPKSCWRRRARRAPT